MPRSRRSGERLRSGEAGTVRYGMSCSSATARSGPRSVPKYTSSTSGLRAQLLGDRDRGVRVPARAAAGESDLHAPPRDPARVRERSTHDASRRLARPRRSRRNARPRAARPPPPSSPTSAEPPEERNGSGIPVSGIIRVTPATLISSWNPSHASMPGREQRAEHVGRAVRDPRRAPDQQREQQQHDDHADEPQLLADDRHHAVRVRRRQVEELLPRHAQPEAPDAPGAERHQQLQRLEAEARGVRLGRGERGDALQAVARTRGSAARPPSPSPARA